MSNDEINLQSAVSDLANALEHANMVRTRMHHNREDTSQINWVILKIRASLDTIMLSIEQSVDNA